MLDPRGRRHEQLAVDDLEPLARLWKRVEQVDRPIGVRGWHTHILASSAIRMQLGMTQACTCPGSFQHHFHTWSIVFVPDKRAGKGYGLPIPTGRSFATLTLREVSPRRYAMCSPRSPSSAPSARLARAR
jgi:hypothetical protein